jgi:hypothetical protein
MIFVTAAILSAIMGMSMTAYAGGGEEPDITPTPTPIVTPEPTPQPSPQPLTPPGNLTLVDDLSGAAADGKQFITVITKSGNYFYIIIDRAGDRQNVHFLNLVDEADLMAILEGDKKQTVTPAPVSPVPGPTTPTPEPTPEPKKNNMGGLLIMLLLLGALGGGAYYYFKVLKPKQDIKATATSELDDFDFDGDDDDLEFEDREPDIDDDEIPDFSMPESEDNE